MALVLKHQTDAQFLSRLREFHRNAVGEDAIKSSAYITAAVQRGDLTDAAMRAQFGMTVGQWAAAKGRMNALVQARNAIRAAIGE